MRGRWRVRPTAHAVVNLAGSVCATKAEDSARPGDLPAAQAARFSTLAQSVMVNSVEGRISKNQALHLPYN